MKLLGWTSLDEWVDTVIKQVINHEHVNIDDLKYNINVWKKQKSNTDTKE